ncbi:MAG TPA: hypothetical protein VFR35_05625, partial [Actinoplanes sp.]|nr:hypothetical protein [Actinoplanes sp.]
AVAPTPAAVRSGAARADVEGRSPDVRVTVDVAADEPDSYPLTLIGYQVTCAAAGDSRTAAVERFLAFALGDTGQAALERLGYAPLPDQLRGRVRAAADSLSDQ